MTAPSPASHLSITPTSLYVGTPVMLLASLNADGTPNLAPASSYWALGRMAVIGLEDGGHTLANLQERPDLTINFPSPMLWEHVERLAQTTGADPVPEDKREAYRTHRDKFAAADLTPQDSVEVGVPRVLECELQLEAWVRRVTPGLKGYHIVEAEVVQVHAAPRVVVPGTQHVDPAAWDPTVYVFRHYVALGETKGRRPKSDVPGAAAHRPSAQYPGAGYPPAS